MSALFKKLGRLLSKGGKRAKPKSSLIYDEDLLQYSKPGQGGECELIIGLDFGTSASKVVIQAPDLPGSPSFAVNFCDFAHPSMAYLLPTKLCVMPNGKCYLNHQEAGLSIGDIKLELFISDNDLRSDQGPTQNGYSAEITGIAYLALLLRYSRKWFLESQRSVIEHFSKLIWNVNLGVPSPCIEENENNIRFRKVGKAAWLLSVLSDDVTIDKAEKELHFISENPDYWDNDSDGITCDFDIIPEIAAGAVGYALSDIRRQGAHVMVDIGASTIDVCSFLLHQSVDNRYSLLTADVQQLGTIKLHYTRIRAIQQAYEEKAQQLLDKHDPLTPISENIEPYLLSNDQIQQNVNSEEEKLRIKCRKVIRRVIHDMKKRRAPNEDVWDGVLPILLIGGGSKLSFFRYIVEDLNYWTQDTYHNEGVDIKEVLIHEKLRINKEECHRLAVAWGLSHRALDIGDIIPADRIDDIDPPSRRKWENNYISKDQV